MGQALWPYGRVWGTAAIQPSIRLALWGYGQIRGWECGHIAGYGAGTALAIQPGMGLALSWPYSLGRVPRAVPWCHRARPQLSERMDLLLECLERLQSRLQSQHPVRGDAAHLREQIRENSLALGELEKLGVALEGVRAQGEELLATMQAVSSDAAARGTATERGGR